MDLWNDLRVGARGLNRHRGLTITIGATLAVGIGVVTTLFSLVNSVAFRASQYGGDGRLVALSADRPDGIRVFSGFLSLDDIREIRRSVTSFSAVGVYRERPAQITLGNEPFVVAATELDADLWKILAQRPKIGRPFSDEELRTRHPVVIVSDSLWRFALGGTTDIVGRTIVLEALPHTVIGVMPRGFRFYEHSDIWLPLGTESASATGEPDRSFAALASLAPGAVRSQARAELRVISSRLAAADPQRYGGWSLMVRDDIVDRNVDDWFPYAGMVGAAALCVLLVACSNVATLLLARATHRRTEMAIRTSLGASRLRLVRQTLTESALLGLGAGAIGTLVGDWGVRVIRYLLPTIGQASWVRWGLDWRVLAFVLVLSVAVVFAFGLLPALELSLAHPTAALKLGAASLTAEGSGQRRGRRLVIAEIALSVVLFVSAALCWRTYQNLSELRPGYQPERVAEVTTNLDRTRYPRPEDRVEFFRALGTRLITTAPVELFAVEAAFGRLTAQETTSTSTVSVTNQPSGVRRVWPIDRPTDRKKHLAPRLRVVSEDYLRVLGVALVRGRAFDPSDRSGAPVSAIVSERLARAVWGTDDVLGERFRLTVDGELLTVVGVSADMREVAGGAVGLSAEPVPYVLLSERQAEAVNPRLLLRLVASAPAPTLQTNAAVRLLDANQPPPSVKTLADKRTASLLPARLIGVVFGAFALTALILAILGTYGVVSYSTARRTREIAIRMALGAHPGDVKRLVLRDGARTISVGLLLGLFMSAVFSQALLRVLWGVRPIDAATYSLVATVFAVVALTACYVPASRAARMSPMTALHVD